MFKYFSIAFAVLLLAAVALPLANAQQWEEDLRIPDQQGEAQLPQICADSYGNIHVVWYNASSYFVCYTRSTDGGTTWENETVLANVYAFCPSLCVDSYDNIHVVWADYRAGFPEIFYRHSTDQGITWENDIQLTTFNSTITLHSRICCNSSGDLHVTTTSYIGGAYGVYYVRSPDGGTTWENSFEVAGSNFGRSNPFICAGPSNDLHMVWSDLPNPNSDDLIYYSRSTDGGNSWSAKEMLVDGGIVGEPLPDICSDSAGNIHFVCNRYSPGDLAYRRSTDSGLTWENEVIIAQASGNNKGGRFCTDSLDNLHLVWVNSASDQEDIYYNVSKDGGTTWGTETRLTDTTTDCWFPSSCADPNTNLHVVWQDQRNGDWDIYYKKGIQKQNPVVDVMCNGEDTGVVVTQGENCFLTYEIEARDYLDQRCDIWLITSSSTTQRYYSFGNYSSPDWRLGVGNVYSTGPLQDCFGTMLDRPLPIGSYTVYGILDYRANGKLNVPAFWVQDEVNFTVVE